VTEKELIPLLIQMTQSPYRLPWPMAASNQRASRPILPENLDTFPSMLVIAIINIFDSEDIAKDARNSDKDLIALLLPGSKMIQQNSQQTWTLLWEFAHDPQLAVLIFEPFDGALIRTRFLVDATSQLHQYVARTPQSKLTLEQLFDADPIYSSMHAYVTELKRLAGQRGYTYRVVKTMDA